MQQQQSNASAPPALEDVYLLALTSAAKAQKLDALMQDTGNGKTGRLWLCPPGTTVPQAQLAFTFDLDSVTLGILTRDERELVQVVKYAEGIEGFLSAFARFMQAGRLAAPRAA